MDEGGHIVYESPSLERVLGWRPDEIIGQHAVQLIHPDDQPQIIELLGSNITNYGAIATAEYRCLHRNGSWRILESIATNRLHDPNVRGIVVNSRDITERKEQEAALRSSNERFEKAFEYAAIGMAIISIEGTWLKVNSATSQLLGYSAAELNRLSYQDITHPDDLHKDLNNVQQLLAGAIPYYHMEKRYIHKDGHVLWAHLAVSLVRDENDNPVHFISQIQDISERKSAEAQLLHDALHDSLTGLANRALLADHVSVAYNRFVRKGDKFALLLVDLDRFKNINDTMGHYTGDQVLLEVARRFRQAVRSTDTVARLGGDEFAILLEDISGDNSPTRIAERLLQELHKPIPVEDVMLETGASIGVVVATKNHASTEAIFRDADIALYRAKNAGRGNYQVFDQDMHARIRERMELEHELRRAIERDELEVHLQPVVSLHSGKIVSFEALMRWNHPNRGLVSPAVFIPIAEETGLILSLGQWMTKEVCKVLRKWPGAHPPPISINASPAEIIRPAMNYEPSPLSTRQSFDQRLRQTLETEGISPELLRVEVTESVLLNDATLARKILNGLSASGFKLLLDDFGTGYSSFSYLQDLPFFQVKLDPTFTAGLKPDSRAYKLISGIVSLAHTIGLEVVAEGIEGEEQLALIREAGCDHVQGYYISRPIPVSQAIKLYQSERRW